MDPTLIDLFTETLQADDAQAKFLELAPKLGGLPKDLREIVAYAVTEKLHPHDAAVLTAFAPYRKDVIQDESLRQRLRTIINSMASEKNTYAGYPAVFDLTSACLLRIEGEPDGKKAAKDLADLAGRYAQARRDAEARKPLADWLYTAHGDWSPAAQQMIGAPAPAWLREKFERVIGDAKPTAPARGAVWAGARDRLGRTWDAIRNVEPSVILAGGVMIFATILFVLALIFTRPGAAQASPEPTVYEELTKRLKERQEIFPGATFLIVPRGRDNADKLLAMAITNADLKGVTVVPPSESRQALGQDVPGFSKGWVTSEEIAEVMKRVIDSNIAAEQEAASPTYYVDLEIIASGQARASVISVDGRPGVVIVVSGLARGLMPAPKAKHYLDQVHKLTGDPKSPEVWRQLRMAQVAAATDLERAEVHLTVALVKIADGKAAEAEDFARPVWRSLTDAQKKQLTDPIRTKLEKEMQPLNERVNEQVVLKK